jgi:DNA-binding GntR family transcriptional regulator
MAGRPVTQTRSATSKSQVAYDWIRDRIRSGAFGPGYRLVLSAIASELEMSVVPVREAISHLTAEGLVTFERNIGARVAMVDASQYLVAMEVIGVIESAATALAAPRLTAADLTRARELNEVMRSGLADFDSRLFSALNQEFHHTLYAKCPNPRLLEMVTVEWARLGHLRDSIFSFVPRRPRESVCEHDALLDLIEAGAGLEAIEHAVREHRTGSLTAFRTNQHLAEGA